MNLEGIITISGRPGLFKVITQGKNSIIVESLIDKRRFPAYASDRISALEDISIFTYDEDAPLKDILNKMFDKEGGKEVLSHKEDIKVLQNYILEILPNYDQERVYPSDLKKIFQWYNLLLNSGFLTSNESSEVKDLGTDNSKSKEKTVKTKKEVAGKEEKASGSKKAPIKPKAGVSEKSKSAKPATAKKVTAVKTGSSRGK